MPDDIDVAAELNASHEDPISAGARASVASSPEAVNTGAPTAAPADTATNQTPNSAAADDDSDAADRRANYQQLFEIIRSCAAPTISATKWDFLKGQDDLLRIDMSPSEFVEALKQDYPVELLHALGLLERVEGELRLPSSLDGDAQLYVKIDDDKQTLAFSTGNEFLFPMTRTALDYALERIPPDSCQMPGTLFIVASPDDAELMRRLGLAAVVYEGLEILSCQDIQRLFDGDHQTDFRWRYQLVLLDFNLARIENRPTGAIREVIKKLANGADVYGVDPARRFAVCRPSAHEFQVLEQAIAFQDSTRIGCLLESLATAAKGIRIHSWRTHLATPAVSFSAARQALVSALERSNDVARRAEVVVALPAYRDAGRRTVMQKFHAAIDRASDPFAQIDLIAAAAYAEDFLDNDPLLRAAEFVLTHWTLPCFEEIQEELRDKRQRSLVELRRIRRESKNKR